VQLETPPETVSTFEFAAQRMSQIVRDAPGRSVGVLVRSNAAVAELIYHLRNLGVDASEEGGIPPTDSAAVLLVLSALRLADHPGDTVARFHVANSPLGAALGVAPDRGDAPGNAKSAAVSQAVRRKLAAEGYGRTIYDWAKTLAPHCNRRELSRLEQLVALAYGYDPTATLRTDDFRALVERQRVADPLAADVRVMTVHQAKGLQFDVVVLPELDAGLVRQSPNFVEHRPDPTAPPDLVCRYVNTALRPLLPAAFQQMFDEAIDRDTTEALCVLYVAMTRAVHALDMLVAPRPKGGAVKTFAGLLRAAFCNNGPAPAGSVLYEHGDPKWHAKEKVSGTVSAKTVPDTFSLAFSLAFSLVKLAPPLAHRRRGLNRASPSGLEGGSHVRLKDLFRGGDSIGMQRGTLIHAWFEEIHWLDDGAPADKKLHELAAERLENAPAFDVDAAIADFRAMLANEQIARYLRRGAYNSPEQLGFSHTVCNLLKADGCIPEVFNERRFAIREGDGILTGSVDRLIVLRQGGQTVAADILDFKTDSIDDKRGALDAKVAFYRPQVEAYRRAVATMLHLAPDRIASRLLFVGPGLACAITPS
jgi:ATP-dependent exoDNAse (exonuclease V) beta subunit